MSETTLRWKGRLGSLKGVAALVLLFAVIFLFIAIGDLQTATSNPTTPQEVKIGQLVNGEIGTNRYVTVSGLALYSEFYSKKDDERTVEQYYFIVDENTGDMVLVEAAETLPLTETEQQMTISGMTHNTESKLQALVESDLDDMRKAGVQTTATLYVSEKQKPASVTESTLFVGGLLILIVLCVATFFFSSTVFSPSPIDFAAAQSAIGDRGEKASGRFQQLVAVEPSFVFGKNTRQFNNAVVNIVPLTDGAVLIYIRHIQTTRAYGVKVNERKSDWGLLLDRPLVQDVEPGKVYSWRDRLAVRVRFAAGAQGGKPQTLIMTFNHAGAQQDFINLLRQRSFPVGSGDAPVL